MQYSSSITCGLKIVCVVHGSHKGGNHLWGVEDDMSTGIISSQVVDNDRSSGHNNLIFIVQQLNQLRNSKSSKVSIILQRLKTIYIKRRRRTMLSSGDLTTRERITEEKGGGVTTVGRELRFRY